MNVWVQSLKTNQRLISSGSQMDVKKTNIRWFIPREPLVVNLWKILDISTSNIVGFTCPPTLSKLFCIHCLFYFLILLPNAQGLPFTFVLHYLHALWIRIQSRKLVFNFLIYSVPFNYLLYSFLSWLWLYYKFSNFNAYHFSQPKGMSISFDMFMFVTLKTFKRENSIIYLLSRSKPFKI